MPGSAFTYFDKLGLMLKQASAPVIKAASASIDDTITGLKVALPASADDPAIKGKAFAGMMQDREIPAFLNILKGAAINRAIIIPAAVGLNALFPALLVPILALGGAFLSYEAGESILHALDKKDHAVHDDEHADEIAMTPDEFQAGMEKGILSTDITMTSEVTGIAMGAMSATSPLTQLASLAGTSLAVSAGVFGTVFVLIRADNWAMALKDAKGDNLLAKTSRGTGDALLKGIPPFMKGLSVVGTGAMFWIGGELMMKAIAPVEHLAHAINHGATEAATHLWAPLSGVASTVTELGVAGIAGLVAGTSLAVAHKVAGPYIDPPLKKLGTAIGNVVTPVINAVKKTLGPVLQKVMELMPFTKSSRQEEFIEPAKVANTAAPAEIVKSGLPEITSAPSFNAVKSGMEAKATPVEQPATSPKPIVKEPNQP